MGFNSGFIGLRTSHSLRSFCVGCNKMSTYNYNIFNC